MERHRTGTIKMKQLTTKQSQLLLTALLVFEERLTIVLETYNNNADYEETLKTKLEETRELLTMLKAEQEQ
jgi:hypothetical protein